MKLNPGQDFEARFGHYFVISSFVEMLMFGRHFEVDGWSII